MATVMERSRLEGSERVERLREKALCSPSVCTERGLLMTESYKETEGQPPVIRRAKALAKILQEMTISIDEDELIVGRATTKQRGAPLLPEISWQWYLEEMDTISKRDYDRFAPLAEEEKAKMRQFLPYWKGKSLHDKWLALLPENAVETYYRIGSANSSPLTKQYLSHNAVDYEKVLTKGLSGVKKEVDDEIARMDVTDLGYLEKYQYLKAMGITLEATMGFARRYAGLARKMVKQETDPQRKAELERIAGICDWIPANPARSFHEAIQSVWFTFIALMIEGWGPGLTFGRADQYLYPFYKKDIAEGRITREEVRELIALLFIKVHGLVTVVGGGDIIKYRAGFIMLLNVILGGVTPSGKDAVNELSYVFLDADEDTRFSTPDIVIRVNRNTPDAFLMRVCEALKRLKGKYKFVSDETAIQQLLTDGKPAEMARDYIVAGCRAPTVPGRSFDLPGATLNLALMMELTLNDGRSRFAGEQIGPQTGDPRQFKSYEEVWAAYKKQVEAQLMKLIYYRNIDRKVYVEDAPTPLQSALFDGCIQSGRDIVNGGTAPYNTQALSICAAPNVGDSLAAIKKVVFEDRTVTMGQLIDALEKNFAGHENVLHALNCAPKFGNDDDYVDSIVNDVVVHFSIEAAKYRGIAGAVSTTAASVLTANVTMGHKVGALPDGRKAGEPLSEGGLSPYQGRNISGPTATMRSVAKLDHLKLTNGSVLNMRFHPDVLKDESKIRRFASLIRTYCESGGFLVQFNIISTDILRDAQKQPEKYRDLLVRVATYSAYFVELAPEVQDDIIARTEFEEV